MNIGMTETLVVRRQLGLSALVDGGGQRSDFGREVGGRQKQK